MKQYLVYLLIGLLSLGMCLSNRGKRGGRNRRINVILSNRDHNGQNSNKINHSNLIEVPLLSDCVNPIEVIISDRQNRHTDLNVHVNKKKQLILTSAILFGSKIRTTKNSLT